MKNRRWLLVLLFLTLVTLVGCSGLGRAGCTSVDFTSGTPSGREVAHNGLTLRLDEAVATATVTRVRFTLRHPNFPPTMEGMYRYSIVSPLQPGKDLRLEGFTENTVYGRKESRDPGALHLELELPPPARPDTPVTVEILSLRIHSEGPRQVTPLTFKGPWCFTFVPVRGATETPKRVPLDRKVTVDGVTVEVRDVLFSPTETVVTYRYPGEVQMLGSPQLECGDRVMVGQDRMAGDGPWLQTSFPALPPNATSCRFRFGPFLTVASADIRFTLHWDVLADRGEEVRVGEYAWHFAPPAMMKDHAELAYTPANDAARRLILVTAGDAVRVVDEGGTPYPVTSWRLEFDTTTWAFKRQVLILEGLVEPVQRLDVHTTQVGHIVGPVEVEVPTP